MFVQTLGVEISHNTEPQTVYPVTAFRSRQHSEVAPEPPWAGRPCGGRAARGGVCGGVAGDGAGGGRVNGGVWGISTGPAAGDEKCHVFVRFCFCK